MKLNLRYIALGLCLVGGYSNTVLAAGTQAGTQVDNLATLTYRTSATGTDLTLESSPSGNSAIGAGNGEVTPFIVDRKLDFEVITTNAALVNVLEGDTAQEIVFQLTNTSNDTLDFWLAAFNRTSTTTMSDPFPGTDSFDVTQASISITVDGVVQDYVDELAPDGVAVIRVLADIPNDGAGGVSDGDQSLITLVAQVAESGTASAPGALIAGDTNGNAAPGGAATDDPDDPLAEQDVFAEGDAATAAARAARIYDFAGGRGPVLGDADGADGDRDGQHSATSGYIIQQPEITVSKTSAVIWDPVNCSNPKPTDTTTLCTGTNPKAIPGAVIEYTIQVNNSGSADVNGERAPLGAPINMQGEEDPGSQVVLVPPGPGPGVGGPELADDTATAVAAGVAFDPTGYDDEPTCANAPCGIFIESANGAVAKASGAKSNAGDADAAELDGSVIRSYPSNIAPNEVVTLRFRVIVNE